MKAPRKNSCGRSKGFLALPLGAFLARHRQLPLQPRSWGWIRGSGTPLLAERPGAAKAFSENKRRGRA